MHSKFAFLLCWVSIGICVRGHCQTVDYARDIRPLLSDRCFRCHGPDDDARATELRLDTEQGQRADLGGYHAIVPGNLPASDLIARITSNDPDLLMPPLDSNKSLTQEERELFARWIAQGAEFQQHWAFLAPTSQALPDLGELAPDHRAWPRTGIDHFILVKLKHAGLAPSSDAQPYTLVRRLYLDLIGLPPRPSDADYWVARIWSHGDATGRSGEIDEGEFQALITHLLASPNYGQRWGRLWLDLARYADTNGYEKDRERSIWPYRDWVVRALNKDMPFDQFTIEQIAGDMLTDATQDQIVATGFHRNSMINEEGGIDPLEFRFHAMTDRVSTTGTTWLGLTLSCCQCHSHKYDPISHIEYYRFMALLNNADEPQLEIRPEDFGTSWDRNREKARKLLQALPEKWAAVREKQADGKDGRQKEPKESLEVEFRQWLQAEHANTTDWKVLHPHNASSNLPILTIQDDGSIFASGDTAKRDVYVVEFKAQPHDIRSLRLEALPDDRLPAGGPGSTYYEGTLGDFFLNEIQFESSDQNFAVRSASESYAKNRFGKNPVSAQLTLDKDVQTGWSVHDRQGERHEAVFILQAPIPAGTVFSVRMTFGRHFASSLGKFRFSASNQDHPQARDFPVEVYQLLCQQPDQLTAPELELLRGQFLLSDPKLSKEASEILELQARPRTVSTLVLAERPEHHPRKTYRHERGEYLRPAEQVQGAVPQLFDFMERKNPSNRLEFARWLVAPDNPLTARVVVNRTWATFFGTGIVKTVDDFGFQGQPPSHPELLDWLALRFMRQHNWSLKSLHREIVSSRTYRQQSSVQPMHQEIDPDNRLLARMPRLRLEAEVLRDSMLVVTNTLANQIGGPPVRPPQPAGITEVTFGSPKWKISKGADRYRRSIYTFAKRTAPFAMFASFDAPSGESCVALRQRSNSPLQALTLLNDVMTLDFARMIGKEYSRANQATATPQLVTRLFRSAVTRSPSEAEQSLLKGFFDQQLERFNRDPDAAAELMAQKSTDGEISLQAAWAALGRVVMSLDEFQTRE